MSKNLFGKGGFLDVMARTLDPVKTKNGVTAQASWGNSRVPEKLEKYHYVFGDGPKPGTDEDKLLEATKASSTSVKTQETTTTTATTTTTTTAIVSVKSEEEKLAEALKMSLEMVETKEEKVSNNNASVSGSSLKSEVKSTSTSSDSSDAGVPVSPVVTYDQESVNLLLSEGYTQEEVEQLLGLSE